LRLQETQLLFLEQTLIWPPLPGSHRPPAETHAPLTPAQKREDSTQAPAFPVPLGHTTLGAGQAGGGEGEGLGTGEGETDGDAGPGAGAGAGTGTVPGGDEGDGQSLAANHTWYRGIPIIDSEIRVSFAMGFEG